MKKVGKRMALALEVLAAGGYFRMQLESGWHGEKFKYRLRTKEGHVVPGVGFQTYLELEKAGRLLRRACEKSSVWPQEWIMPVEFGQETTQKEGA
jgi:hypothetical protein